MRCSKCGNPLPNDSISCKICGTVLEPDSNKSKNRKDARESKKIEMLSEKYGQQHTIEYRKEKDNNNAIYAAIILAVLFLIVVSIFMFILNKA